MTEPQDDVLMGPATTAEEEDDYEHPGMALGYGCAWIFIVVVVAATAVGLLWYFW